MKADPEEACGSARPERADRPLASLYIQVYIHDESEWNLWRRGFDFEFATLVFDDFTLEREDTRHDYGERRNIAVGIADGLCLTVVYTDRIDSAGAIRRIISARVSSRHERKAYFQARTKE